MPNMMPEVGLSLYKTWSINVHRLDLTATTAMDEPVGNALIINAFRFARTVSQKGLELQGLTSTSTKSHNGRNHQARNNCLHYRNVPAPIMRAKDVYMILMVIFDRDKSSNILFIIMFLLSSICSKCKRYSCFKHR